jgi:hypothetical protein
MIIIVHCKRESRFPAYHTFLESAESFKKLHELEGPAAELGPSYRSCKSELKPHLNFCLAGATAAVSSALTHFHEQSHFVNITAALEILQQRKWQM